MATERLTDTEIKAAIARRKPAKLFDGGGLYLLIRPAREPKRSPSAYWRHKHYVAGNERLVSHGVYPRVTLKMARSRRDALRALLEADIDPSAQRKARKAARRTAAASTFHAVAEEWFEKRKRSWAESNADKIIARLKNDVFPWIGEKPVARLTSEEILDCLRRVEDRGALESARRVRQYINSVFEYARDVHIGDLQINPTPRPNALASPEPGKFASITDPAKAGALIRALRGYQGSLPVRVGLQLAALLFVRPGELRAAEWSEFDLDGAEWRIPAGRMKMRTQHVVPLSDQAVALLRELQPLTGSGRFVFPSERSPLRPISANTLTAALRNLGYDNTQMTVHGFRHMASTLLNESGQWHADAIERQLAHMPKDSVRAAYNAAQYMPERRRLMQWWAHRLDALADAAGKIVRLKEARQ